MGRTSQLISSRGHRGADHLSDSYYLISGCFTGRLPGVRDLWLPFNKSVPGQRNGGGDFQKIPWVRDLEIKKKMQIQDRTCGRS